jgi:hypothetical protein
VKSLYGKKWKPMPSYLPTEEEWEWYLFCVRKDIRISPWGIPNDMNRWKICINLGPYKRGEKRNLSPFIYDRKQIWPAMFKMCKYYYDKYK